MAKKTVDPQVEEELKAYQGVMIDDMTPEDIKALFPPGNPGELKVTEEEWGKDWQEGVEDNADRWKRRTVGTKKDVIKLGAEAEPKYKDKVETAIKLESRKKALEKTSTEEWREIVNKTDEGEYSSGATKRRAKMDRKIALQYDLRVYAKGKMDEMPEATDAQREKKMIAARRTNIAIGQFIKGIIDAAACKKAIDDACPKAA